jgi:phosphatidylglycerol:prolipoprotein diacylglycerol transferase
VKFPQELLERAPELTDEQSRQLHALITKYAAPGDSLGAAEHRMIEALQRGEAGLAEALAPLISARHPSQLYQGAAEGVLLFVALWVIWARARRPGVVTAWFLMLYGIGRVLTELIRLPDANVWRPHLAGLSRGQWLSLLMIGAGGVILWWAQRRSQEPRVGGWMEKRSSRDTAPTVANDG